MKYLRCLAPVIVITLACVAARCTFAATPQAAQPWKQKIIDNPNRFQFAIVADRTGGRRPGVFANAIRKLNLLQPDFVMSIGDLIEGDTDNETELEKVAELQRLRHLHPPLTSFPPHSARKPKQLFCLISRPPNGTILFPVSSGERGFPRCLRW